MHPTHAPTGIRTAERAAARPWLLLVAAAVLILVVAGGIAVSRDAGLSTATSSSETGGDTDASSGAEDARSVPEFTAQLRSGGSIDSSELQGPAMIQVFASWCPACQAHAPSVAEVQSEFGDLETYYINVADDADPAAAFIDEHGWADSPVLVDDDRSIAGEFGLTGQPHTIFLDADGEIAAVLEGGGELGAMRAAAERVTAS